MYSRNINVFIQSTAKSIENSLHSFIPATKFQISFVTDVSYEPDSSAPIDVVIIDTDNVETCALPTLATKPMIIFLSVQNMISEGFLAKLHLADQLWLNFADERLVRFYLEKLLADIEFKRESFMTNSYLDVLLDNVPDLIWFKDLGGIHLKVNDAFCEMVGKPKTDVEGRNHYYIWDIPKEVYERSDYVCLSTDDVIIETLKPQAFDEKVVGKKGLRQFVTYKAPLFDEHKNLVGTMGCAHDVTEFKNISTELGMILDNLPFAIVVKDNHDHVLIANEKFVDLFNPTNKSLLGRKYAYENYLLPNSYHYIESQSEREITLSKDEQNLVFSIQSEPLYDFFQNPLGSLYIYRDVTLERGFQKQMRQLAYTDQLTGLYQRRYLYEMENTIEIQKLSLLYIDLDNFKYINDTFGHIAGDKTLCEFGNVLKSLFDKDIVARIGGDEFVVIITRKISKEEIKAQAQALIDATMELFEGIEAYRHLSASVGIACAAADNASFDALLKKADKALYQAKNIGKNCYVLYDED